MNVIAIKDYEEPFVKIYKGEKYKVNKKGTLRLDGDDCIQELDGSSIEKKFVYLIENDNKSYYLTEEKFNYIFNDLRKEKLERLLSEDN